MTLTRKKEVIVDIKSFEKQLLNKLGIDDFRHMTKEKFVSFMSMIPEMDPEVAKAVISKFPAFANIAKETIENLKSSISKAFESNDSSMKGYNEASQTVLKTISKELDRNDLSDEQRDKNLNMISDTLDKAGKIHSENQTFLKQMAIIIGTVALLIVGSSAALLGANINIPASGEKLINAAEKLSKH